MTLPLTMGHCITDATCKRKSPDDRPAAMEAEGTRSKVRVVQRRAAMHDQRARVLVVDNAEGTLSSWLAEGLARHDVEFARDAFDAIHRIDDAGRPHDVIFCDLASRALPGPELWAYLALMRAPAAARMVFVASTPLPSETTAFVQCIPNPCVDLPVDAEALHALVSRRAGQSGPSLPRREPPGEGSSERPDGQEVA